VTVSKKAFAELAIVVVLTACGSGGSGSSTTPASPTPSGPRPSSTATLTIVSPTNGEVVKGPTVDLKVDLKGGKIVQATSTVLVPNEGHLHVILDDKLISMTTGTELKIPAVAPGHHLIRVEFVANDHFPFNPRVLALTSFEVKG
jgi:hypothetical protein